MENHPRRPAPIPELIGTPRMGHAAKTMTVRERLDNGGIALPGKDGQSYLMRPIRPADAASLMRGFDAMTDNAKWFRMLSGVPHLTEAMAMAFCRPDPQADLCVVIEGRGALAGEILGGARIAGAEDGISAEFSVSLRPEAEDLGLARKALETVFAAAKDMGYARIFGSVHARNAPMLELAKKMSFRLRRDPQDASLMLAELLL
jgi:RimJ/RimL family protein N-acetyltransferase